MTETNPARWAMFRSWLANPLAMGSIVPSSAALSRLIARHVVRGPDEVVVEFGPGTGAVTRGLLDSGVPADRLISIEIDGNLVRFLRRNYPKITVIEGDCCEVERHIGPALVGKVGTLIVGIPMVMLPTDLQHRIVSAVLRVLAENRRFLHYTFCATSPLDRKRLGLKGKRLGWTLRNFPPASVWGYWRDGSEEGNGEDLRPLPAEPEEGRRRGEATEPRPSS